MSDDSADDRPSVEDVLARARARVEASGTCVSTEAILAAKDADKEPDEPQ